MALKWVETKTFKSGVVLLHYNVMKGGITNEPRKTKIREI